MRVIWNIAWNDLRVFLKDKGGYIWLFVMPVVFIYFFGVTMRGEDGEPSDPRPRVSIDNQDTGYLGLMFVDLLEAEGLRVSDPSQSDKASRKITIPADFTRKVEAAEQVDVQFSQRASSGAEPSAMIEVRMARAIVALTSAIFSLVSDEDDNAVSEEALRELLAREKDVELEVSFAGRRKTPAGFEQSVPGYAVMFVLMNLLIFGGLSISGERTNGVLRRLAVNPLSYWQLITGKILGRFLLGIVQILFLLVLGWLVFGIDYGGNLPLVGVTLLTFAWGCAALGVLVGAVIKEPETVQGVCTLAAIPMAALGGCWWPLEIVPEFVRSIGYAFPTAWTMDALHQLISFGGGLADITFQLSLIFAFSIISTLLAAKFLRVA